MAVPPDERPLKLATVFNGDKADKQFGWQKVDELTVLERKMIPFFAPAYEQEIYTLQVTVYDFLKFEVTTTVQREDKIRAKEGGDGKTYVKSFSELEGKQAIRDAHRALTELGGTPPSLDEIQGIEVFLKKDVSVGSPIKLKPAQPQ